MTDHKSISLEATARYPLDPARNPQGDLMVVYIGDTLLPNVKRLAVDSHVDYEDESFYGYLYSYSRSKPKVDVTFSLEPDAIEYNGSKCMYVVKMSDADAMIKAHLKAIRTIIEDNAVSLNAKSMIEALDRLEETC